ncbi:hypothetical protein Dcar01_01420 [Deinococcus carri]|uniref:MrfA-like Zn-binding domain-containing protein n=1 Tax=Deinococcus carri TaxID=1211323 RepID=A0ABP9W5Q8_9DEIO
MTSPPVFRKAGEVRPSQLITTFGPGAIVDTRALSVIVGGLDTWNTERTHIIREPRLERILKVSHFLTPSSGGGGGVPAYVFPRYQHCPECGTLSLYGSDDLKHTRADREPECNAPGCNQPREEGAPGKGKPRRVRTVPAPIVVACAHGHLDDFPWREYVHRGDTECTRRLRLFTRARTGSIADLVVECDCGRDDPKKPSKVFRSLSDAFNQEKFTEECKGRRPWMGMSEYDAHGCQQPQSLRAMQRVATNGWFSVVRSALSIGEQATPLRRAVQECNQGQIEKLTTPEGVKVMLDMGMFPSLSGYTPQEVWDELQRMRGLKELSDTDLRRPEWEVLRDPDSAQDDQKDLFLEGGEVPTGFETEVTRVVLARKLLEVRALVGFTRIDAVAGFDDELPDQLAPLSRTPLDWLPAVEVRGEGIFIELNETKLREWEGQKAVRQRALQLAVNFSTLQRQFRGRQPVPFPGARYVLLHSLSHALIRQLSLDCGYSASAIRERIYSSTDPEQPMSGILLYTASADTDGSLGGLVDLGSDKRLPELLRGALRSMERCSSDPLCADHEPAEHGGLKGAACHACVLASETSCETFNRFLDRNFLVPTMARSDLAFFGREHLR